MSDWLMEGIPRNIAENPDMKTVERIRASIIDDNGQTLESSMLMPCPFCGCDRPFVQTHDFGECTVEARVVCSRCHVATSREFQSWRVEFAGDDLTRTLAIGRAVSRWNRRAERTCRVEVERRKLSQTQTAVVKSCSECGFEFGVEKENTFPFEVTTNVVVPPNYCPNCGAKVVER